MHITPHALDRFREHHPDASWDTAASYFRYGTKISSELAQTLSHRRRPDHSSEYKVSPDFRGLFVADPLYETVITYLRLPRDRVNWLRDQFTEPEGATT